MNTINEDLNNCKMKSGSNCKYNFIGECFKNGCKYSDYYNICQKDNEIWISDNDKWNLKDKKC